MQGCIDPKPKKKTHKTVKHEKEEGSFKRSLSNSQNGVEKRAPKNSQIPSAPRPQGHSQQRARLEPQTRHTRAPKISQIGPRPENVKNTIFKTTSALQPQAVLYLPNPIWSKIRTSEKQIVRPAKIILKKVVQNRGNATCPKQDQEVQKTPNRSETLCFEKFRVLLPLGVRCQDPRCQRREKIAEPHTKTRNDTRNGIFQKKTRKTSIGGE